MTPHQSPAALCPPAACSGTGEGFAPPESSPVALTRLSIQEARI